MNVDGIMTDQTATYAPGFNSNPSLARVVLIADFDNDGWKDVVVVNTNSQVISTNFQTQYYKNMGELRRHLARPPARRLVASRPFNRRFPASARPRSGDPDGDGDLDLFLGDYNNNLENRIVINNGTRLLHGRAPSTWFPTGNNSSTFSVETTFADADGDGDQDIFESDGTVGLMKVHVNRRFHTPGGPRPGRQLLRHPDHQPEPGDLHERDRRPEQRRQDRHLPGPRRTGCLQHQHVDAERRDASRRRRSLPTRRRPRTSPATRTSSTSTATATTTSRWPTRTSTFPAAPRHAVLYRNGTIGPAQTQLLVDPWGSPDTYLNIHTQGTHDLAILDLNGDGLKDIINGRCNGYHVFIQDGPPFSLAVTEPTPGAINMVVAGGVAEHGDVHGDRDGDRESGRQRPVLRARPERDTRTS